VLKNIISNSVHTYTGLFPDRKITVSIRQAGSRWKRNIHILWTSLLFFMLPPGYHTTPLKGTFSLMIRRPLSTISAHVITISELDVRWYIRLSCLQQTHNVIISWWLPTEGSCGSVVGYNVGMISSPFIQLLFFIEWLIVWQTSDKIAGLQLTFEPCTSRVPF